MTKTSDPDKAVEVLSSEVKHILDGFKPASKEVKMAVVDYFISVAAAIVMKLGGDYESFLVEVKRMWGATAKEHTASSRRKGKLN